VVSRGRLLVAEDHEGVLNSVLRLLSKHYDVIGTVKDGRALLEAAGAMEPDVLVVDISMPIINGLEAARILKKTGCKSKIVFLTAHDDADFISAAQAAGGLGYVLKQQMATDLPVAIKSAMAGKSFISSSSVGARSSKKEN
jgi:DNA-binding NarL/FixJ family response regulator